MPIFVKRRWDMPRPHFPRIDLPLRLIQQRLALKEDGKKDRLVYKFGTFDKGYDEFWIDGGPPLHHMRTLYTRGAEDNFLSKIDVWGDPDDNEMVIIKYVKPTDKEVRFIGYLNATPHYNKLRNLPEARVLGATLLPGKAKENKRVRVPIAYHVFNGDLQDFILPTRASFYNTLDARNVVKLGQILGRTYQHLVDLGFFYTDSKPANVLYHFIRPRRDNQGDYPFNVVLGDLGSMVNVREEAMLQKKNPKYRTFAAQTYPYPIRAREDGKGYTFYRRNDYEASHENRLGMMPKVVVWGLGILLLQMFLTKPSHQEAFFNAFSHATMTEQKYLAFLRFLLNSDQTLTVDTLLQPRVRIARLPHQRRDRLYLNDIPQVILDIVMLRGPSTLDSVVRALHDVEERGRSNKRKRGHHAFKKVVRDAKRRIRGGEALTGQRNLAARRATNRLVLGETPLVARALPRKR